MARNERKRNRTRTALIASVIAWVVCILIVLAGHSGAVEADTETVEVETLEAVQATEADGHLPGDDVPAVERCYLTEDEIEEAENEMIEAALLANATKMEGTTITYYCVCEKCCGKSPGHPAYGITASGLQATPGVSVAVDPAVIPLGSDVLVDFGDGDIQYYRADDTGNGVSGNHIDILVDDHATAVQMGVTTATVYWIGG